MRVCRCRYAYILQLPEKTPVFRYAARFRLHAVAQQLEILQQCGKASDVYSISAYRYVCRDKGVYTR